MVHTNRFRSIENTVLKPAKSDWTPKFYACTISIFVHLIILSLFGVLKLSQSKTGTGHLATPVAKITQLRKLLDTSAVLPKPKVKRYIQSPLKTNTIEPSQSNLIFTNLKPQSQNTSQFAKSGASTATLLPNSSIIPVQTEFFGSLTNQRKICYVVDCSGSMKGVFSYVQKKLVESIEALQPDQFFCIIFFGNNRLLEFGDGRLLRASPKTKSAAYAFIDSIQPIGQTNAYAALEKAVKVHDSLKNPPSVIYFLTDGFELTNHDIDYLPQKIVELVTQFAPKTRINTIGFWPQQDDRELLHAIAGQTKGQCILINSIDN